MFQGSENRVQGLGSRVQGSKVKVGRRVSVSSGGRRTSGCRVQVSGCKG
jgi:hypothetical protein